MVVLRDDVDRWSPRNRQTRRRPSPRTLTHAPGHAPTHIGSSAYIRVFDLEFTYAILGASRSAVNDAFAMEPTVFLSHGRRHRLLDGQPGQNSPDRDQRSQNLPATPRFPAISAADCIGTITIRCQNPYTWLPSSSPGASRG